LSTSWEGFRAGEGLKLTAGDGEETGEGLPSVSLTALGYCDENWHGNATAFQDLELQAPDLDVYAVDDPDDPIVCDGEIRHIR
jgi:hypothetical protein